MHAYRQRNTLYFKVKSTFYSIPNPITQLHLTGSELSFRASSKIAHPKFEVQRTSYQVGYKGERP